MSLSNILTDATQKYEIKPTKKMLQQFETYFKLLVEWNEKMNLTAITDEYGVAVKHFADCLAMFNYVDVKQNSTVIDVGTGAGFPGVVLKIARPDLKLTLLDSLNKRLVFLDTVLKEIGLEAELVHYRAEEGSKKILYREQYDYAVSRAVARMNVLSEYCLPYVKQGGSFVAMKGPNAKEELSEASNALKHLGGKIFNVHKFNLPDDEGERTIIEVKKIKPTPKTYPRISGKIKSQPL